ncbi:alpha/beta-Hydrolases superfamily protein [Striga asiatica]|uniref:Alpha/beta-Hydrolases superfamily protein n=1 Tax=Striga asiatica TaxID=4170 RepID=A0A5A7Q2T3_STRAF|nr:alpha/beta-Hydrolases superfamily protein [Striga asiatica]
MAGNTTKKISAASARAHTRKSKKRGKSPLRFFTSKLNQPQAMIKLADSSFSNGMLHEIMIAQIAIGSLIGFLGYAYLAIRPPAPKICGSPGGPPVTSSRVKLSDGRHLAYKERGIEKEKAYYKIIVSHGFGDSKDFNLPVSEELINEVRIYILSFDRGGYGESDPNPARTVKSDAFDIQELADKLNLGPRFYLIGISMGAYPVYGCLKYLPHRVSGAALVSPVVNYWWRCFPPELSKKALGKIIFEDRLTFRIAHYAPWLLNWWMTQKLFPSFSLLQGKLDALSRSDIEILKQSPGIPKEEQEKILQQGAHECLHRDMMIGFGKWDFEPMNIVNPFPNKEGSFHMWHGYEDKAVPQELNRYLAEQLPWIQYHEVPDTGHLLIYNSTLCESIITALLSS